VAGSDGRGGQDDHGVAVLVVDDHDDFRALLREVVGATPGMTVVGEASSGEEAIDAVAELSPDLVIMDKRMPGLGGLEAARHMGTRHADVKVVLVSVEGLDAEALADSGAVAFLYKRNLSPRALAEIWQAHRV
jgi:DNA-binding NarL/FixJ family response regulator